MITDNSKILIINIEPNLKKVTGPLWRISGHILPLGLYNLVEIYPNRTDIISLEIDKSSMLIDEKEVKLYSLVLVRFTSDIDVKHFSKLALDLRSYNPLLTICIVGNCKTSIKNFDITCFGTGVYLLKNILNCAHSKKGFIDTLSEDIKSMPIPISNFGNIDHMPTVSNIEKSLSKKTIEIQQPWAGFLDNTDVFTLTNSDLSYFNNLIVRLKDIGFSCFHINLKEWNINLINKINASCMASNTDFSIYCTSYDINNLDDYKGSKLKRIWLPYDANAKDVILKIKQANIELGLELTNASNIDRNDIQIINNADRFCLKYPCDINQTMLRVITYKYWSHKNRFVKRLLKLSSLSELIDFIKLSYTIIEILLMNKGKIE